MGVGSLTRWPEPTRPQLDLSSLPDLRRRPGKPDAVVQAVRFSEEERAVRALIFGMCIQAAAFTVSKF